MLSAMREGGPVLARYRGPASTKAAAPPPVIAPPVSDIMSHGEPASDDVHVSSTALPAPGLLLDA